MLVGKLHLIHSNTCVTWIEINFQHMISGVRLPWRFSIVARWRCCFIPSCTVKLLHYSGSLLHVIDHWAAQNSNSLPLLWIVSLSQRQLWRKQTCAFQDDLILSNLQSNNNRGRPGALQHPGQLHCLKPFFRLFVVDLAPHASNCSTFIIFLPKRFWFYKHSRALCSLHSRCVPLCSSFFFYYSYDLFLTNSGLRQIVTDAVLPLLRRGPDTHDPPKCLRYSRIRVVWLALLRASKNSMNV